MDVAIFGNVAFGFGLLLCGVSALIGFIALRLAWRVRAQLRRPATPIAAVREGLERIEGRVASQVPLVAPFSGTPVVFAAVSLSVSTTRPGRRTDDEDVRLHEFGVGGTFSVVDPSGRASVSPAGALLLLAKDSRRSWVYRPGTPMPQPVRDALSAAKLTVEPTSWVHVDEQFIRPDEAVTVAGIAKVAKPGGERLVYFAAAAGDESGVRLLVSTVGARAPLREASQTDGLGWLFIVLTGLVGAGLVALGASDLAR